MIYILKIIQPTQQDIGTIIGDFIRVPVKVALVNNPKTPRGKAISLIASLHKRDLQQLMRNKNVPSAVRKMAMQRFKEKYRGA